MSWGPNPIDTAAAERAAAEARERIEARPLTPGERQIVNALERIADAVEASKPIPLEPLIGNAVRDSTTSGIGALTVLLDADPSDLSRAVDAGATVLANAIAANAIAAATKPLNTRADYERLAEAVIDAALKEAASPAVAGGQDEATNGVVAGSEQAPPATTPTT